MTVPKHLIFDEIEAIRELVEDTPPGPLKALDAEYEIALTRLASFLSGTKIDDLDERSRNLAERLARHFLFNYYIGFTIAKFSTPYGEQHLLSARQRALEDAVQKLSIIEPARELMTEWFVAALEGRLHRLLREWLDADKFTLYPHSSLSKTAARVIFADDWETLGQYTDGVFKVLHFALGGFYLIFRGTGTIRPCEFKALIIYLQRITTSRNLQNAKIPNHFDVFRVLEIPSLLPSQLDELTGFVFSLLDLNRFPSGAHESSEDPLARDEAVIDDMGFSRNLTTFLKIPFRIKLVQNWSRKEYERSREIRQIHHPNPEQEELADRRLLVSELLSVLTMQSDQPLQILEQEKLNFSSSMFFSAFKRERSSFIRPALIKYLDQCLRNDRWGSLSGYDELQKSNASLDKSGMQFLIDIFRQQGDCPQWAWQILGNVPYINQNAESWLIKVLQDEENPVVIRALIHLHQNLAQRQQGNNLEEALISCMKNFVITVDISIEPEWINWLINLGRKPLKTLLDTVRDALSEESLPARISRFIETLCLIASQAERVNNIDAVCLAACWLVDPDNWLADNRSLIDRIKASVIMLDASDTDQNTQATVVSILEHAIPKEPPSLKSDQMGEITRKEGYWTANYVQSHPLLFPIFAEAIHLFPESRREGANKRLIVAKALGKIDDHHLALPLLKNLLDVALEMGQAWADSEGKYTEFHDEAQQIAREVLKSITMLKPISTQAILLIQKMLMASRTHDSPLHSELSADFIHELMLLLTHDVDPEAVPVLIELVWRNHCGPLINNESLCVRRDESAPLIALARPSFLWTIDEKIHRYLHLFEREGYYAEGMVLLCGLQSLANVTSLTLPQQQIIWRVYRSSWHALTKSLCLLILGRQRPVREETVRELIRVLRQDPTAAYWKTINKQLFRSLLFGLFNRMHPPEADLNYTYLCQTIAVSMVGSLLNQERRSPMVHKHRRDLEDALFATTSIFRYGMETHVDCSVAASEAKGMMRLMGASQPDEEQTTWMAHPADRAYQVLQDLIAAGVFSSIQNLHS